jgi:hypothetical protein
MTASEIMTDMTFACLQAALWNQCMNRPYCPVVHSGVEWLGSYPQGMWNEFKAPYVTVAVADVAANTLLFYPSVISINRNALLPGLI